MSSKSSAVSIAVAALVIGGVGFGATAAHAQRYPADLPCTASSAVAAAGSSVSIGCGGFAPGDVTFTVVGPGVGPGTLASVALAAVGSTSIVKQVSASGEASVAFRAPGPGVFNITATDSAGGAGALTITVPTAAGGTGSTDVSDAQTLPVTGGEVSPALLWAGIGAVAVGGIAIGAVALRRRSQS